MFSIFVRTFVVAEFIVLPMLVALMWYAAWKDKNYLGATIRTVIVAALLTLGVASWDFQNTLDELEARKTAKP